MRMCHQIAMHELSSAGVAEEAHAIARNLKPLRELEQKPVEIPIGALAASTATQPLIIAKAVAIEARNDEQPTLALGRRREHLGLGTGVARDAVHGYQRGCTDFQPARDVQEVFEAWLALEPAQLDSAGRRVERSCGTRCQASESQWPQKARGARACVS